MNTYFDHAKGAFANGDLDWPNQEYRAYAIDMTQAGPEPGAWTVLSVTARAGPPLAWRIQTIGDNGVAVGDLISFYGGTHTYPVYANNTAYPRGVYVRPPVANGKRYKVVSGGTTGSSPPPTWPLIDGRADVSGGVAFMCDGPDGSSRVNGLHRVVNIVTTTTFEVLSPIDTQAAYYTGFGKISNLSKTYLSEFAPSGAISPASGAFTGKVVLPGSVLDATNDPTLDLDGRPASHALVVCRTSLTNGGAALADTAQHLFLYYDTLAALPYAADAGVVQLTLSNSADKLCRF